MITNREPIVLFIILLFLPGCSNSGVDARTEPETPPAAVVESVVVEVRELGRSLPAVGSLDANETVSISNQVEGVVEKLFVDVGDAVRKGQVVAQLDARELELTVQQQAASLQQELARLGLSSDDADVNEATTTQVRQAEATFNEAKLRLERVRKLVEEGVMPQQVLDEQRARYDVAEANLSAARETVRNIRASITARRASLGLARKKLEDARIVALLDGYVQERQASEGQYLRVNTPVVTIVQNNPLKLRVEVPENVASAIRAGQAVSFDVDAFPGRKFEGTISRISPSIDQQSRTLKVEALVRNREGMLKPGFFARVTIETGRVEKALVVPATAIFALAGLEKVFVIENGKVAERIVRTGSRLDGHVEIQEGVKEGERGDIQSGQLAAR